MLKQLIILLLIILLPHNAVVLPSPTAVSLLEPRTAHQIVLELSEYQSETTASYNRSNRFLEPINNIKVLDARKNYSRIDQRNQRILNQTANYKAFLATNKRQLLATRSPLIAHKYKVPYDLLLSIYSLESSNGTSSLATKHHNLFGMRSSADSWASYKDYRASIIAFCRLLRDYYDLSRPFEQLVWKTNPSISYCPEATYCTRLSIILLSIRSRSNYLIIK